MVQIGGRSGVRGSETASGSLLMEIGSAEGAKFPEGIEGRSDNAGKVVPVVGWRRRIVGQQARSWRGFRPEVATTTVERDRVESGRPD